MWEPAPYSTRHRRLPPDWRARRRAALERDGHRCTQHTRHGRCWARATDVDHIEPGDNHEPDNLASMCRQHHMSKTAAEGGAAAKNVHRRNYEKRFRPTEKHPGIVD